MNERITLPFLDELSLYAALGFAFVVRGGKFNPGFAKESAEPGCFRFFGDSVFEVIMSANVVVPLQSSPISPGACPSGHSLR